MVFVRVGLGAFVALILSSSLVTAGQTETFAPETSPVYVSIAPDIPVPVGASEIMDAAYLFESDSGHIAETTLLLTTGNASAIIQAYARLLPPLGWEPLGGDQSRFKREGAVLTLTPAMRDGRPVLGLRLTMP